MRFLYISILLAFSLPGFAAADNADAEIEYLLNAVGDSGCTFIRNGKRHDAGNAEDHLRMKYRRGKRYATTAENFIERLASASSMSKKPYSIDCGEQGPVSTGEWLTERLAEYRAATPEAKIGPN